MYSNKPIVFRKDRRKKPDIICNWLEFAGVFVWVVFLAALILYQDAQPQNETFFDRLLEVKLRQTWDFQTLNMAIYLLLFLFVLSIVSIVLNLRRMKRSTDHLRLTFVFSLVGSLIGLIMCIYLYIS